MSIRALCTQAKSNLQEALVAELLQLRARLARERRLIEKHIDHLGKPCRGERLACERGLVGGHVDCLGETVVSGDNIINLEQNYVEGRKLT